MAEIIKKAGRLAQANEAVYNIINGFKTFSNLDVLQEIVTKASVPEKE